MPTDQPQLSVFVTEIGREAVEAPELTTAPRVDLADIRAWRFYHAAPEEFFLQYAGRFWVDHVHVAFDIVGNALRLLSGRQIPSLTLAGHFGGMRLSEIRNRCRELGLTLSVHRLCAPRALTLCASSLQWQAPIDQALAAAGIANAHPFKSQPSLYWTNWFNRFFADEVLPVLRVRKADVFFGFMKTLSEASFTGLNWAGIGARCGISGPCARDWCSFLIDAGVIELLPAASAPAPRRAKQRPKLCWNAPGLAVWLSDAVTGLTPALRQALTGNAVYLALKDAYPEAHFAHFLDTNYVTAPLLIREGTETRAIFFPNAREDSDRAQKHQQSLLRAGITTATAYVVTDNADLVFPGADCLSLTAPLAQTGVPR